MENNVSFAFIIFITFVLCSNAIDAKVVKALLDVTIEWQILADAKIDHADIEVFIPSNSANQKVLAMNISEQYVKTEREDKILLHLRNVKLKKIYGNFIVETNYIERYSYKKAEDLQQYLNESEFVIINDEIKKRSRYFSVPFPWNAIRIAHWVYDNIEYNESYSDAAIGDIINVTMSSDWVFEHGVGVCDEFSHLFLALARAAEIPARIVSGAVLVKNNWIPHSWVEVYSPMYGWIEIDPTHDEYINLNALRLRTGTGVDQSKIFDRINVTTQSNVTMLNLESSINISIKNKTEEANLLINVEYPVQESISKIQPLAMSIKNDNPSPIYTTLSVVPPFGVRCVWDSGECRRDMFLTEGEEKKYNITLMLGEIAPNVKYTFPVFIETDYLRVNSSFSRLYYEEYKSVSELPLSFRYFIGIFLIAAIGLVILSILMEW